MRILIILSLSFFFAPFSSALAEQCPEPLRSAQETLACIISSHPKLKALSPRSLEFQARESQAKAIPNPDLDTKTQFSGEKKIEVDLVQPIELGGKRSARIDRARAENNFVRLQDDQFRAEIASEAVEALARIRQLKEEAEILTETSLSVGRITSRLKTRPTLPPDQVVALKLFSNYLGTVEFKKLESERNLRRATQTLEFGIGRKLKPDDSVGIPQPKKWPAFKEINPEMILPVLVSQAEVGSAEAEVREAKSQSWPDLKLGPSFERVNESGTTSLGAKIGISLPLWTQGKAGRELARSRLARTTLTLEATRKQATQEIELIRQDYESAIKRLERGLEADQVGKSIRESEKLFSRGLITPASLIEMYRSSFELVEETHKTELIAWKAWAGLHFSVSPYALELP